MHRDIIDIYHIMLRSEYAKRMSNVAMMSYYDLAKPWLDKNNIRPTIKMKLFALLLIQ